MNSQNSDLFAWLRGKIAEAEKSLSARKQSEAVWRSGTDTTWKDVGCKKNKAQRLQESQMQGRIAARCQRDVEMFKAVVDAIQQLESDKQHNAEICESLIDRLEAK